MTPHETRISGLMAMGCSKRQAEQIDREVERAVSRAMAEGMAILEQLPAQLRQFAIPAFYGSVFATGLEFRSELVRKVAETKQ